ncbi:MAG: 16S rRNA (uracil(1498)-N(3))-methyltransferase, partial [Micromonosporaceae bacterium]
MSPPVFLTETSALRGDTVVLSGAEGRHAATVRRIGPGERVDISDGRGLVCECVVMSAAAGRLELRVRSRRNEPPPQPAFVAIQAIPKGSRAELAVELMTEVGVDVIVPWAAARSVPRWSGERAARAVGRWRDTSREAAKQARRSRIPCVTEPATTEGVARLIRSAALAVVLEPAAPAPLAGIAVPESGDVVVVAGPEGGLTDEESSALAAAGAMPARLGPSVLRTSSAAALAA